MKKKIILFITVLMIMDVANITAQDCIFYENINYEGDTYYLSIGEAVNVFLRDTTFRIERDNTSPSRYDTIYYYPPNFPSWQIRENSGAAIQIESLTPYGNYPFILLNSAESAKGIGGGDADNYANQVVKVSCKSEDELPQPKMFIPVDAYNSPHVASIDSNIINISRDTQHVLVLKKAFLWGNSEDVGCCHGPWGAVSIRAYPVSTFQQFDFDPITISEIYNEEDDRFKSQYVDFRMPGPVLTTDNPCDDFDPFDPDYYACGGLADDLFNLVDFFSFGVTGEICELLHGEDCGEWFGKNPGSEWIDGPWGTCYSNFPVLNWDKDTSINSVFVMLREGDDPNFANKDDYLGGEIVSKDMKGPILVRMWYFGWVELENIIISPSTKNEFREPSVDDADYYWFNNWNGLYPDGNGVITTQYSQYLPLANTSISEMETIFGEDKAIGLLGKRDCSIKCVSKKYLETN